MDKLTRKEIEHHNDYNYHCDSKTWNWIDDTYVDLKCPKFDLENSMSANEGIKSQLIAEKLGLIECEN